MAGGGGSIAGVLAIRIRQVASVKIRKEDRSSDILMPIGLMLDMAREPEAGQVRSFYRRKPHESRLISELISPMLMADLEHGALGGMWRPAEWMQTGWQLGVNQSAYAPDTLEDVFEEAGEDHLTYCKQLYRDCILPNLRSDLALPDLPAAFELYLGKSKDCQLHVPRVRQFNKRIFVARAFDFAAWMGFFSGR